ncbi:MAG: hypothetical protein ACLTXT_04545 [Ruminococcus callidus]
MVTDTEQDDVKFYTDDNTKAIRATDFATKITADVTMQIPPRKPAWTSPVW